LLRRIDEPCKADSPGFVKRGTPFNLDVPLGADEIARVEALDPVGAHDGLASP
jgi:hypothetical protein